MSASTIGASTITASTAAPPSATSAGTAAAPAQEGQPREQRTGGLRKRMMGFMLPHEQFPVTELVEFGIAAEKAGFDLLATSDHFQPWQANEGHAGEAWVTMGALGARTQRVDRSDRNLSHVSLQSRCSCGGVRFTEPAVSRTDFSWHRVRRSPQRASGYG